eukprot:TRINITY_DN4360_c0_g1_i3.p1 TRINITY_DN4360_c0_g1~~TRINITY_DN4360_c0_g1_i3.p1  ORF type:complete len:495 (-),score=21.71 TRINITY_DN4360_c0_g1_i3:1062-2411(-)
MITSTVLTRVTPKSVSPEDLEHIRRRVPGVQEIDLTKARMEMVKYDDWQVLTDSNYRMDKALLESLSRFQNLKRIVVSCLNIRCVADLKVLKLSQPYTINLTVFNEWRIPELYQLLLDKPINLQQIEIFVSLNAANSIQLVKFLQANDSPVKLELAVSNAYFERQFVELEKLCGMSDHLEGLFWRPRPINPSALADILSNKGFKTLVLELYYEYQEWVNELCGHEVIDDLRKMKNLGFNVHSGLRSFVDLLDAGVTNIRRLSFRMGNLYGMVAKEALKGLKSLKNLDILEMRGGLVKEDQFENISQVTGLKELDLEVSQNNNQWFDELIVRMTQLTRLRVFVKQGDRIFQGINSLSNLRSLDYSTDLQIESLDVLKSMTSLTSLMLHKVRWQVWDQSWTYFDNWKNLRTLDAFIQSHLYIDHIDDKLLLWRKGLISKHQKLVSLKLHVV